MERLKLEKIRAAQYYQKLLFQTLDDCLMKFCRRNVDNHLKLYIQKFITIAFFRIKRFQELFLASVESKINERVPEWKGIDWNLDEERKDDIHEGLNMMFDWNYHVFQHIPKC